MYVIYSLVFDSNYKGHALTKYADTKTLEEALSLFLVDINNNSNYHSYKIIDIVHNPTVTKKCLSKGDLLK